MLARCTVVLSLLGPLAAQITPCITLNAATNGVGTTFSAANPPAPNVLAFRFVQGPVPAVLRAAEIYTQNAMATTAGYMRLELWTEDVVTGLPWFPLCGGTWQVHQNLGLNWHGAGFDQVPANIVANQPLWLVWREPGGSRLPYQPGGTTTPVAQQLANGNWVSAAAQPVKWRGWCTQLPGTNVQHTGPGCPTPLARLPVAFTNYTPQLGNPNFQVEATGFAPGSLGLAILGTNPAWVPVQIPGTPSGCLLRNEALALIAVATGTGNVQATHAAGAAGHCWLDFPLPGNPAFAGIVLDTQFAVLDAFGDPLPFVFSSNVRVTLF